MNEELTKSSENCIHLLSYKQMEKGALPPLKMNKITSHIEEKSDNIIDLSWEHYKRVIIISFGSIGVASFFLLLEICSRFPTSNGVR